MPIYLYKCKTCGLIEIQQSIHEQSLNRCPDCGLDGLTKQFVSAQVQFKGNGFYSTDSRGK
jgi:putative FmdB family regulatory protein